MIFFPLHDALIKLDVNSFRSTIYIMVTMVTRMYTLRYLKYKIKLKQKDAQLHYNYITMKSSQL